MTHWTSESIYKLIAEVRPMPEVWDYNSIEYKNKLKRLKSIKKLADQFGTTPNEVVRKLHNLRTQLSNEIRKIRQRRLEMDKNYVSNWAYFKALHFLIDPKLEEELSNISESDEKTSLTRSPVLEKTKSPVDLLETSLTKAEPNSPRAGDKIINILPPIIKKNTKNQQNSPSTDDDETFGLFVASALRNLRSDSCKRKLRRQIQRIILDIEEEDDLESQNSSYDNFI